MLTTQQLDQVFFAQSDQTRRSILARLAQGSATVGELATPFDISAPAISKHMKILQRAGLIERQISGRKHRCSLAMDSLKTAEDWLHFHREFRESRFDALDKYLQDGQSGG